MSRNRHHRSGNPASNNVPGNRPQGHRPAQGKPRTVTVKGISLTIGPKLMDDWELVELLYDYQSDPEGNALAVIPFLRKVLGDGYASVKDAKGESLLLCKCGNPINVQQLREQNRDKAEAIHLTKTPAGMSQWLKDNYGYEVSRKQISNWLNRGKLPSSKPVDDGYWEFNIREILSLAMSVSHSDTRR